MNDDTQSNIHTHITRTQSTLPAALKLSCLLFRPSWKAETSLKEVEYCMHLPSKCCSQLVPCYHHLEVPPFTPKTNAIIDVPNYINAEILFSTVCQQCFTIHTCMDASTTGQM